jgi:hypothetical protein
VWQGFIWKPTIKERKMNNTKRLAEIHKHLRLLSKEVEEHRGMTNLSKEQCLMMVGQIFWALRFIEKRLPQEPLKD